MSLLERQHNRSLFQRICGALTSGGIRQSVFTLISTAMGGGVLCLPYMMKESGWLVGFILLTISSLIAYFSMSMLIHASHKTRKFSYTSLLAHSVGNWTGPALDLVMISYGVGALVAYFIFLGDFIPDVVHSATGHHISKTVSIVLSTGLAIPMVLPAKLSALRYVAPISTLSLCFVAAVVVLKAKKMQRETSDGEFVYGKFSPSLLKAFAISLYAYVCHLNVVTVAGEMVEPTPARIQKVVFRVSALLLCFYSMIGVCGYFSFGGLVAQNFLKNYPGSDSFIVACKSLLSCSLLFCLPMNADPCARAFVHLTTTLGLDGVRSRPVSQSSSSTDTRQRLIPGIEEVEVDPFASLRIGSAIASLILAGSIAAFVPGAADVLGLMGGSFGTILMIVCPLLIYQKTFNGSISTRTRFIMLFMWCAALASFAAVGLMAASYLGFCFRV